MCAVYFALLFFPFCIVGIFRQPHRILKVVRTTKYLFDILKNTLTVRFSYNTNAFIYFPNTSI